jgi:hypothetical protein
MPPPADPARDTNPRLPGAMLRHGGWLSSRCTLSSRDGQALLGARGLPVSREAIRPWFGNVGRPTPLNTVTGALGRATSGPGMQSVCLCTGRAMTCGGRWIRTTTSWRGWCRAGATRTRPSRVSARCSRASRTLRVSSCQTNGSARARPSARYCPEWPAVSVVIARTGVTPRIGRRVHARIACRGVPLPGRPSVCCQRMAP